MRRREFITLLGGAATWPLAVRAQQPTIPVIGFLNGTSPQGYGLFLSAFHQGLSETGYVEGRNVAIEYRWAEGRYEQLPALAADLVSRRVAVIAATSTPANLIATKATKTIPIVFTTSSDPVELGLVARLNKPGGNVTGAVTLNVAVLSKRMELLHEMVPTASVVGVLANPTNPNEGTQSRTLRVAAGTIELQIMMVNAATEGAIDAAFARLADQRAGALLVDSDAFLFSRRDQLIALANRYKIPTIFDRRKL
jgi:putative ABC transport system substrate-binding protein